MSRSLVAVALAVTFCCVGVSLARQNKPQAGKYKYDALVYAELAKAPQKARAKRNPLEKDPDAVAAGKTLFEQHCAECHGDAAAGSRKAPSLLAEQVQNAEPGAIFWILTNGVVWRGMPAWSKLPEPQRWQLVSFVKSLGAKGSAEAPQQTTPPPTAPPSQPR